MTQSSIQLGKNRITENFIETVKDHFKNHEAVKVSVLKTGRESREDLRRYSEEILEKLGKRYTAKVVGFTIFLKRWRKKVR